MTKTSHAVGSKSSRSNIGARVRELRKWLRISQTAVGTYLDIPRSAVSALESGKRDLGAQEILMLSNLLRCDPNSLLGLSNTNTPVDFSPGATVIFNARTNSPDLDLADHDQKELQSFSEYLKSMFSNGVFQERLRPRDLIRSKVPQIAAREIRAKLNVECPIDVYSLIQKIGLYPRFTALENLAGAIVRSGSEEKAVFGILVNSDQPEERTRFSACHEIAHYLLEHLPTSEEFHPSLKTRWKNPIETDADTFAAELLMPSEAIIERVGKEALTPLRTQEIADHFVVSYQAILFRLLGLHLISKVQYDEFSAKKPSELKAQMNPSKKTRSSVFKIKDVELWLNNMSEMVGQEFLNSPDWVRFAQEGGCFEYWRRTKFNERATDVRDVYEQVALWIAKNMPLQPAKQI